MPLIIKASVSRKLTEDFNSRGWSLDIQSELDPRVLDDTKQLADSTNYLFQLANDLLEEQVRQAAEGNRQNGNGHHKPACAAFQRNGRSDTRINANQRLPNNGPYNRPASNNGQSNGERNGGSANGSNGRSERPVTQAQMNAIAKMAERFDTNADAIASEDFNCKASELSIRQASDLIDRLKKSLEAQEKQGVNQ